MKSSFFKLSFLAVTLIAFFGLITSCTESEEVELVSVEDYVDEAVFSMESAGKIGRHGCYDLIFPVTVEFPDETSVSVDGKEELKETIRAWREENPEVDGRPHLAFPFEVLSEDGQVITIDDRGELRARRAACHRKYHDRPWRPGRGLRDACFDLVFPLSIEFPNGSVLEAANPQTLKNAIRAWLHTVDNPQGRPMLVFPVTVEYEDGSQVEVGSKEDLKELKDQCDDSE